MNSRSPKRLSLPVLVGTPLLFLMAGGAVGWFTADGDNSDSTTPVNGEPLPATFDDVAPLHPLHDAPNQLDVDESIVIGTAEYLAAMNPIEVGADAELNLPIITGASAAAVDPSTLQPAPAVTTTPIVLGEATAIEAPAVPTPAPTGVVREALDTNAVTPSPLRISAPFAAVGVFAKLCDEVEAGNVPDPELAPDVRPTMAVLVNQPSTMAISGTWADGATLDKTTMVTLPAHDAEWQRRFAETGEQAPIVACLTLSIDDVRGHAVEAIAQLRASVLAISATDQADLNATVTLNVQNSNNDPLFVEQVTLTGRGEQRRIDGVLYPTMHVRYVFLSDGVVPVGSVLQPEQLLVLGDHAFVEGADCAGWAANQQGIDRTHSGRFSVTTQIRTVAGQDRPVTVVDGDVYLDPTLPGGWAGSFCVRLQVTDQQGSQRSTLALRGTQVRSPRTATYELGVLLDNGGAAVDQPVQVSWSSASGAGCPSTTLLTGLGAQCTFSARSAADGLVVLITDGDTTFAIQVPVNTAYCNPDDPLESGDGCNTGFTQTYQLPLPVTLRVVRRAAPGSLWDDPSNAWRVGPIT